MTVPSYQLHLGAHRTGTTALQQFLARSGDSLSRAGIGFWGPAIWRSEGLKGFTAHYAAGEDREGVLQAARSALAPHLGAARGMKTVLISDENLIGAMRRNYAEGALYSDAADRLAGLRAVLPAPPRSIFFTIREFSGYWQSVYAHLALRGIVRKFEGSRLVSSPGNSWLPVLGAIRRVFPHSQLRVLRYGPDCVDKGIAMMTGGPAGLALPDVPKGVNRSLPEPALRELAALPPGPAREAAIAGHRRDAPPPEPRFLPDEARRLDEIFAQDLQRLAEGAVPGAVLDPNGTEVPG
ncbi:MAG: hypothetical protein KDE03_17355 [Rhodobacteraceae bacterium]|nr:hypothetical protein [Paracoccaceae bacterium]